jgi:hypothetical protein
VSSRNRRPLVDFDLVHLEVLLEDGSFIAYEPTPIDVVVAEEIAGQPASEELLRSYKGYSSLAWSCAIRAGHAWREAKETDKQSYRRWLGLIRNVYLVEITEEEVPEGDPLDPSSSSE